MPFAMWLLALGAVLFTAGLAVIWWPLGLLCAGGLLMAGALLVDDALLRGGRS